MGRCLKRLNGLGPAADLEVIAARRLAGAMPFSEAPELFSAIIARRRSSGVYLAGLHVDWRYDEARHSELYHLHRHARQVAALLSEHVEYLVEERGFTAVDGRSLRPLFGAQELPGDGLPVPRVFGRSMREILGAPRARVIAVARYVRAETA